MSKNISLSDFDGSRIGRYFTSPEKRMEQAVSQIKKSIEDKFEKGVIDAGLKDNALKQLDVIIKSHVSGEGSRGGKIIGHTRSGKPVYDTHDHSSHSNFSAHEHMDAARHHEMKATEFNMLGKWDQRNNHHNQMNRHKIEAMSRDVDHFNSLYNNPDVKVLTISGKSPLSSQLVAITGDAYTSGDFYGSTAVGEILYHKSGQRFTILTPPEEELIKKYQKMHKK